MICENTVRKYCCEDISLIENYQEAINSNETWDCHHKLETELNLSVQELINTNRYYGVKAKDLIFMPHREHVSLHNKGVSRTGYKFSEETKARLKGRTSNSKGYKWTDEQRKKGSDARKKRYNWLTPTGEIISMTWTQCKRYHPDWKLIEESF